MREKLTPQQKRARNLLDKRIDTIVREHCSGIAIDIMDIHKVFQAGYEAAHAGEDMITAVVTKYKELAK